MDIIRESQPPISRLEIVDSGRRRRFSAEAKLAIVAESYSGSRMVTVTARRHGITRWQLNSWRKAAREGRSYVRNWVTRAIRRRVGLQSPLRRHRR